MTPEPSHMSHSWCVITPIAEITSPPHQQTAHTPPALPRPARSSHPPQVAAEIPSSTKKSVYVHPSMEIFQSQVVVKSCATTLMSRGHSSDLPIPIALDSGSQNTENP